MIWRGERGLVSQKRLISLLPTFLVYPSPRIQIMTTELLPIPTIIETGNIIGTVCLWCQDYEPTIWRHKSSYDSTPQLLFVSFFIYFYSCSLQYILLLFLLNYEGHLFVFFSSIICLFLLLLVWSPLILTGEILKVLFSLTPPTPKDFLPIYK